MASWFRDGGVIEYLSDSDTKRPSEDPPSSVSRPQSHRSSQPNGGSRSQRSSFDGSAASSVYFESTLMDEEAIPPPAVPRHRSAVSAASTDNGEKSLKPPPRSHNRGEKEKRKKKRPVAASARSSNASADSAESYGEAEGVHDPLSSRGHDVIVDEEEKEPAIRSGAMLMHPPPRDSLIGKGEIDDGKAAPPSVVSRPNRDPLLGKLEVDNSVRFNCIPPQKQFTWSDQYPQGLKEYDVSNSGTGSGLRLATIHSSDEMIEEDPTPRNFFAREMAQRTYNFLLDDPKKMTYARRLALWLMKYRWYYSPRKLEGDGGGDPLGSSYQVRASLVTSKFTDAYPYSHSRKETPSLEKAWAYFEHYALPRYIVENPYKLPSRKSLATRGFRKLFCKANKPFELAAPGECDKPTELYSPIFTPHKQLGDFGLGVGLYFSTLRAMAILALLAGIINIPNILYFSSAEYSDGQVGLETLLKGSAICTRTQWVPCPDCRNAPDIDLPYSRLGFAHNEADKTFLLFALKNNCDGARLKQGMLNYATIWIIVVGVALLNRYVNHMQVKMDEDAQTAVDYAIVIDNPPPDATDPNEWKEFFDSTFGTHVTTCTVAVNNDLLIRSLVERREVLRRIEMMIEPGTSMDRLTLAGIAAKEEHERSYTKSLLAKIIPGTPELFARLVVMTSKVQGLAQQDYPATHVYIIFEKEADQRRVLEALKCCSKLDRWQNNVEAARDPKHLFRGTHLLNVAKPDEPSTIRWQDLHTPLKQRTKQQVVAFLVTTVTVTAIAFLIKYCNSKSVKFAAMAIALTNLAFPWLAKYLTWYMEEHSSSTGVQKSMYLKIALFRWVNTAIVITIITPFTAALTNVGGLIPQIHAIFFAEIVTANLVQVGDPMGHVRRHILAPRAKTQDAMNLECQGTVFELAERYTSMTKTIFLGLWYCAIYPGAWFMCSFTLFVNYYVDRFSLMRTWKLEQGLGTIMSEINRKYFFPLSLVAMALMSSYFWSGFPFDNLCVTNTTVSDVYVGSWKIEPLDTEPITNSSGKVSWIDSTLSSELDSLEPNMTTSTLFASVNASDTNYQYCLQDFFQFPWGKRFPFVPALQPPGLEWMTDQQETITIIYGWSVVAIIVLIFTVISYQVVEAFVSICLKDTFKPSGVEDQGVDYSDVGSISSYVPNVESSVFSYPLLACPTDNIRDELLEWNDPDRPFSFYDLTKDAAVLTKGMDASSKFSRFAHWIPPGKEKKK